MEKLPKSIHAAYKTHEGFTGVQPQPEAEALCCLPCSHLLSRSPHHHHHVTAEELSAQEEPSCPYRQPPAVHIHPIPERCRSSSMVLEHQYIQVPIQLPGHGRSRRVQVHTTSFFQSIVLMQSNFFFLTLTNFLEQRYPTEGHSLQLEQSGSLLSSTSHPCLSPSHLSTSSSLHGRVNRST